MVFNAGKMIENKNVTKNKKKLPEWKKVNTLSTNDNSRLMNISDFISIAGIKSPKINSNNANHKTKIIHLSKFISKYRIVIFIYFYIRKYVNFEFKLI